MVDEYSRMEKAYDLSLRSGRFNQAVYVLREMAAIQREEENDAEEMKLLMLAFYIGVSGCDGKPHIEPWIVEATQANVKRNTGHLQDVFSGQAYLDTVKRGITPSHIMTTRDSEYLFELMATGCVSEVEAALQRFAPPQEKQ